MFCRKEEGVYTFGSKVINLKLEKNEIKARVGGGWIPIDEYIKQQASPEIDRLQ